MSSASSMKAVGDFALWVVQNDLEPDEIAERAGEIDLPQSVVELLSGKLGTPPYGFPEELQRAALKGKAPIAGRPAEGLSEADLPGVVATNKAKRDKERRAMREALSALLYPEVFRDYGAFQEEFGDVSVLDTPSFLHGLRVGGTASVAIEPGKTLIVGITAIGDPQPDGTRVVYCELNGRAREVRVRDLAAAPAQEARPKATRGDWQQVGAAMPGKVLQVAVEAGQAVTKGDTLLVLEAMKMETVVTAPRDATVGAVHVVEGDAVASGDLLVELGE